MAEGASGRWRLFCFVFVVSKVVVFGPYFVSIFDVAWSVVLWMEFPTSGLEVGDPPPAACFEVFVVEGRMCP